MGQNSITLNSIMYHLSQNVSIYNQLYTFWGKMHHFKFNYVPGG